MSSAGFWPGGRRGGRLPCILFVCLSGAGRLCRSESEAGPAFFTKVLGEFLLPYDAVRSAQQPDATLMEFLHSTYEAAADLAKWDRRRSNVR